MNRPRKYIVLQGKLHGGRILRIKKDSNPPQNLVLNGKSCMVVFSWSARSSSSSSVSITHQLSNLSDLLLSIILYQKTGLQACLICHCSKNKKACIICPLFD